MSDERIPKDNLDLNLYLGLPQTQDLDEDQNQLVRHQQQVTVEEQGSRSSLQQNVQPSLTSPDRMIISPMQSYGGQFLPPQAIKVETTIAEPSHTDRKRLRLRQEQDHDEDQGYFVHHQQQDPVKEQSSRSSLQHNIQLYLASPHRMTSPIQSYGNYVTRPVNPSPSLNFSSPYQSSIQGQFLPPQAVKVETTITEPPHRGRKRLGLRQEQDLDENQGQLVRHQQQQDPVKEQDSRSALQQSIQQSLTSLIQSYGDRFLPPQAVKVETTITEPPHRGRKRLGLRQEQDLDENQGQLVRHQQQEDPVKEQDSRSALQQSILQSLTSLIQSYGDQFLPPQAIKVETTVAEPSHTDRKRLGLRQEQDHGEDKGYLVRHQQQDPVEEQDWTSAFLRSIQHTIPSPYDMMSRPSYDNYLAVLESSPILPYKSSEQVQFPPQTTIAKPSHRGRKRTSCVDDNEIEPPYPWATNRPATIKSKRDLSLENINVITGLVICKSCGDKQTLEYNLEEKFSELCQFITKEKEQMRHQSPQIWMHPKLPLCITCNKEMKPKACTNKNEINWLFLLLGQMLGCCTLEELTFFCKWNAQDCRGANKNGVLYLTYLALCKKLEPNGPFDP